MSIVPVQSKPAWRHYDQSRSSARTHFELAGVEKIYTPQDTQEVYLVGGVSPDKMNIMVIAGTGQDSSHAQMLSFKNEGHSLTLPEVSWSPRSRLPGSEHISALKLDTRNK